ncbi:tRNA-intron lyase [Halopenitus sp. POP-27]|uniref:tRNA-intron lyase n=1 Tax=Halopenitus sp. POP-27 TaxID=2994425 RepID=UPI002469B268|nr:tRNA-intron lyase [Halopenitus sp. POP-27]
MQPDGELRDDGIHVGGDARQRFYDSRGYGRPRDGNAISLTPLEAAHLLFRGDLGAVTVDGEDLGFEAFFVHAAAVQDRFAVRFLVYADLRDRGFYLSPTREGWPGHDRQAGTDADFIVYERGESPPSGGIAHRLRVVGERESILAAGLAGTTLAVVDEESDITYFETAAIDPAGGTDYDAPQGITGVLLADRVVVWDAPTDLYDRGFYGRPLSGRAATLDGALQLSLLEAAYLAGTGSLRLTETLALSEPVGEGGTHGGVIGDDDGSAAAAIRGRGRAVEGEKFDRRRRVYRDLRDRDIVPKTGFKFGADFRTYLDVETVEDLPHSEHLVRVIEPDHAFVPRELSLDVRLAGGVRKRMVFALTDASSIDYLSVDRLTP